MKVDSHLVRWITVYLTERLQYIRLKDWGGQDLQIPGLQLDDKLDWTANTDTLHKKGQSRLYFLRRLGSFNICKKLLQMFYQSVVASVLFYAVVCWGGNCKKRDAARLDRLWAGVLELIHTRISYPEVQIRNINQSFLLLPGYPEDNLFCFLIFSKTIELYFIWGYFQMQKERLIVCCRHCE